MPKISPPTLARNGDVSAPVDPSAACAAVLAEADALIEYAFERGHAGATFTDFERELANRAAAPSRAVIGFFLGVNEGRVVSSLCERVAFGDRVLQRAPARTQPDDFVRHRALSPDVPRAARGFHPLAAAALGLLADRISPNVLSTAVRLATRMSFSDACEMMRWFVPAAPSTEVLEARSSAAVATPRRGSRRLPHLKTMATC